MNIDIPAISSRETLSWLNTYSSQVFLLQVVCTTIIKYPVKPLCNFDELIRYRYAHYLLQRYNDNKLLFSLRPFFRAK
jgi:hypothetical protein